MSLAAICGAKNLAVTFAKPLALSVGVFGKALMTGCAFFVFMALHVLRLEWAAACVAGDVLSKFQPVRDADPLIKDETGTLPKAFLG